MSKLFQERLKQLRKEKGITQKELAYLLNTGQVRVWEWETGRYKPSMTAIIELTSIFKVSADYLLGLENEDGTKSYYDK